MSLRKTVFPHEPEINYLDQLLHSSEELVNAVLTTQKNEVLPLFTLLGITNFAKIIY